VAAHFPQPSIDGLPARGDPGIANARIFGKYAFIANGTDVNAVAVGLKQQPVSGPNTKESANFDGHDDLAFARDFGLLLHGQVSIPYFGIFSLLGNTLTAETAETISKALVTLSR
jgi:hypothetical protein